MDSLSDALRLEECCYTCTGCGRKACRDATPSPREDEDICADCCEHTESVARQLEALYAARREGQPAYDPDADTSTGPRSDRPCGVCGGIGTLPLPSFYYTRDDKDRRPCWACRTFGVDEL